MRLRKQDGQAAAAHDEDADDDPKKSARSIWTGSISFGLVNIPIRLYPATRSHQLAFHQFDAKSHARIRYKRVVEGTDDEVPYAQIVDGYEVKKGEIVTLSDEEMAAAEPKKSRSLDIEQFVPLTDIDPISWNHTYYVAPDDAAGPRKAYAVLREAMEKMERVAIGRMVMRTKQYLVTLRPYGSGLALQTMFFADEIRAFPETAAKLPAGSAREVEMAKQLIESFVEPWHHAKYHDTYRDRLVATIKQKAKGRSIEAAPRPEKQGEVIDLMEALKKSLGGGESKPAQARKRGTISKARPRKRAA